MLKTVSLEQVLKCPCCGALLLAVEKESSIVIAETEKKEVVNITEKPVLPRHYKKRKTRVEVKLTSTRGSHRGKNYVCDVCSAPFTSERYLANHKARAHVASRGKKKAVNNLLEADNGTCDVCFKKFYNPHASQKLAVHKAKAHRIKSAYRDDVDEEVEGRPVKTLKEELAEAGEQEEAT